MSSIDLRHEFAGDGFSDYDDSPTALDGKPPRKRRLRFLSVEELAALPKPAPIIEGVLFRNTLAAIVAQFDSFKTFIALDQALSIEAGLDWHGHPVMRGPVAYIAAEAPFWDLCAYRCLARCARSIWP